MADAAKHNLPTEFRSLFSFHKTRKTVSFLYGFMLASLVVTVFFAFSPSANSAAPWLSNVFAADGNGAAGPAPGYGSRVSSFFSYLFSNTSENSPEPFGSGDRSRRFGAFSAESSAAAGNPTVPRSSDVKIASELNQTRSSSDSDKSKTSPAKPAGKSSDSGESKASKSNQPRGSGNSEESKASKSSGNKTQSVINSDESKTSNQTLNSKPEMVQSENKTVNSAPKSENKTVNSAPKSENKTVDSASKSENKTVNSVPKSENKSKTDNSVPKSENKTVNSVPKSENKTVSSVTKSGNKTVNSTKSAVNQAASFSEKSKGNGTSSSATAVQGSKVEDPIESLRKCDLFDGTWVRDDSYGLYYKPGSCSLVDEQFDCVANGRPDLDFQRFKWKPKGCSIPRLDGKKMLEMLRGKRLVFVGDSLNRNMWESLVCILKNSAKDPSRVFEAHGHQSFRAEASYSFIFKDYDCTVEFFVTPFLVQESEIKDKNGAKKETLRIDLMSKSAVNYKSADVIVFNTGHWWTHDKTSKGEDYYQEGDKVYKELSVFDAFRKAISTWGKWVDNNVNPNKSLVFFRGYSHSHFSGGQWNSGGACDSETVPIKNETYLRPYLRKMVILEEVLTGMKTDVTYLNVTKMTDFRKDAHPSIYRRKNTPEEELKSPLKYQDCSHWCLPGVPDAWNEVLYAKLLVKFGQKRT